MTFPGRKEPREIRKGPIIFLLIFVAAVAWMAVSIRHTINEPLSKEQKTRITTSTVSMPAYHLPEKKNKDGKPMNLSERAVDQCMNGKPLKLEWEGNKSKPVQVMPESRKTYGQTDNYYPDAAQR